MEVLLLMKRVLCLVFVLVLVFSLTACGDKAGSGAGTNPPSGNTGTTEQSPSGNSSSTGGSTVKIGVMTDRSSPAAATSGWGEAGAEVAAKLINAAGGIDGKMIELIYRDTASDSANVAQKATELVAEGVVAILGPKSDGEAPTGAQWAETNKFPMVTPCTMNTRVTIENASRYMFSCGFHAWAIANMNADYAAQRGFKSAYFIGNDGGASGDSRDFFYRKLGSGFANLGSSQVSSNTTEFSNVISSVVGKNPDTIIGAVAGPNFVSLVNQGQQFGLWDQCEYLGWYTVDSTNTKSLADAGNYPYGRVHGVALWPFWMSDIPGNDELVSAYGELGGIQPSDMGFCWYMGIISIAEALKTTNDWSPEGVTSALENVRFDTLYGKNLGFRDFDHVMNHAYYYVTAIEDPSGKWDIPIGDVIRVYMAADILPDKAEMIAYAQEVGLEFKDLSTLG